MILAMVDKRRKILQIIQFRFTILKIVSKSNM